MSAFLRNLEDFQQVPPSVIKTFERNGIRTVGDFLKAKPTFILYVFNHESVDKFRCAYEVQEFKQRLVAKLAPAVVRGDRAVGDIAGKVIWVTIEFSGNF